MTVTDNHFLTTPITMQDKTLLTHMESASQLTPIARNLLVMPPTFMASSLLGLILATPAMTHYARPLNLLDVHELEARDPDGMYPYLRRVTDILVQTIRNLRNTEPEAAKALPLDMLTSTLEVMSPRLAQQHAAGLALYETMKSNTTTAEAAQAIAASLRQAEAIRALQNQRGPVIARDRSIFNLISHKIVDAHVIRRFLFKQPIGSSPDHADFSAIIDHVVSHANYLYVHCANLKRQHVRDELRALPDMHQRTRLGLFFRFLESIRVDYNAHTRLRTVSRETLVDHMSIYFDVPKALIQSVSAANFPPEYIPEGGEIEDAPPAKKARLELAC